MQPFAASKESLVNRPRTCASPYHGAEIFDRCKRMNSSSARRVRLVEAGGQRSRAPGHGAAPARRWTHDESAARSAGPRRRCRDRRRRHGGMTLAAALGSAGLPCHRRCRSASGDDGRGLRRPQLGDRTRIAASPRRPRRLGGDGAEASRSSISAFSDGTATGAVSRLFLTDQPMSRPPAAAAKTRRPSASSSRIASSAGAAPALAELRRDHARRRALPRSTGHPLRRCSISRMGARLGPLRSRPMAATRRCAPPPASPPRMGLRPDRHRLHGGA